VLRELRRRQARRREGAELTYRELAAATGWSHGIIGEYLAGNVLPPTDRFDTLIRLLGATPAEQGALATARDRIEERRRALPGARPPAGADHGPPPAPVPRQLPADVSAFVGRADEIAELDARLRTGGSAVVISAVSGTPGVGKTTLAVRCAHRVAGRFPDGQLYIDLRGYGPEPPVPPDFALGVFLRSLGLAAGDIPQDTAERAACYRTLLADRCMLVVLDNARSVDQVRPLLPGTASSAVIVTSRDDLAGLVARDGATRVDLDVLAGPEAATLLRTLIGARVDAEPEAAAALAERCARLPLALRIVAEIAMAHPEKTLTEMVDDLTDERRRLDLLDAAGDRRTAVRAVFSWSYQQLSPGAARAFALIGSHPGRHIDAYAVAALTGTDLPSALSHVDELRRAHLIEAAGPRRHAMHDLLRAYAAECLAESDEDGSAVTRLLDFFVFTAASAVRALFPHDAVPTPARPTSEVPAVDRPELASRWLDEQRANLVAIAGHAAAHGHPQHAADVSRILWRYLEVGGHYQDALAVHGDAARVADRVEGGAAVLANLGNTHWWLGAYRDALVYFERSLAGHRSGRPEAGDAEGEARALARIGVVHERLGDYTTAIEYIGQALDTYHRLGNRHGEGAQLVNLGAVQRRLGHHDEAAEHERRAADIFHELGDARLEGYALGNLGAVYSLLGRDDEAIDHLETALACCRETGDRGGEASALGALGAAHARRKRFGEALDHLHPALAIAREISDRGVETETLNTLGETLSAMEQPGPALERHRAALVLSRQTGDRYEQARALDGVGVALSGLGRTAEARRSWFKALAAYERLAVPEAARVREQLERIAGVAATASPRRTEPR
jgi:tetratricopeptide (TPR) repeat protein